MIIAGVHTTRADGGSDVRLDWPAFLYKDLRDIALSVHVSGTGGVPRLNAALIEREANSKLSHDLQSVSLTSVPYSQLLQQQGYQLDPSTLLVFCEVRMRTWRLEGDTADVVLGSVDVVFGREGKRWRSEREAPELFASRAYGDSLAKVLQAAISRHLERSVVTPLGQLVKH